MPKPKRKTCECRICGIRSADALRSAYMRVVASSYTRDELKQLVRMGRATLLPRDDT
jgi:hypothetical protein